MAIHSSAYKCPLDNNRSMCILLLKESEVMKGIKALLQAVAVAAYTSGWWAVGVFGLDYPPVCVVLAVLIVATTAGVALLACWLVNNWDD